jgi:predicted phosphodiesterase
MNFAFDLISDLHTETWPQKFQWQGMATSPYCVVVGDVARDRDLTIRTLRHLGQCYQAVFYIDGNDEHSDHWDDLNHSYQDLARRIKPIRNVIYLQDNVVVINGVAILGTNGWWGFDFGDVDATETALWYQSKWQGTVSSDVIQQMAAQATNDAVYMASSIKRLQTHQEVKHIVVATHTVPNPDLISHDIDLWGTYRFNCMGNNGMVAALQADACHKIHTWCFGHYHMPVDQVRHGVRYVNNCRGRGDSPYRQWAYQPRRIEIEV